MAEYRELVADFAQRTLDNLDFLQDQEKAGVEKIYPVTQLWNSLLGLLVLPYERELERIEELTLHEMYARGWPRFRQEHETALDLRDLIRRLRNAVTHYNVEFRSGPDHQLRAVVLTNHRLPPRRSELRQRDMPVTWKATISLADLERLARLTAELYVECFSKAA